MLDLAIVFVGLMAVTIFVCAWLSRRLDHAERESAARAIAFAPPSHDEIVAARLRGADVYHAAWALLQRGALEEAAAALRALDACVSSPAFLYGELLRATIHALRGEFASAESYVRLARAQAQRQGIALGPQLVDALLAASRGDCPSFERAFVAIDRADVGEAGHRVLRFLRAALPYRGIDPIWPSTGDGQSVGDSPLLDVVLRSWPHVILLATAHERTPYRGAI